MDNFGFEGRAAGCSIGCPCEPIGVARDSLGAPSLDAKLNLGIPPTCSGSGATGRWFGEGGMANPSLSPGRPPCLFPPGCGGLRRGTGEDMVKARGVCCRGFGCKGYSIAMGSDVKVPCVYS